MSDWLDVFHAVKAVGGEPRAVIERAKRAGASPELVLEGVRRAPRFDRYGEFEDWEALPPGCIDPRVFMQSTWWVDVLRRPHRIADMSDDYIRNVIAFLEDNADYFYERYRFGHPMVDVESPSRWLDATPLMRALWSEGRS